MSYSYLFKLIIIGDSGVGKSCLLLQFIDQKFRAKHEVTVGVEFGAKMTSLNSLNIKLQIWDTAGQESFVSITRSYYRTACAALLVFDITRRDSFESLGKWLNEAKNNGNSTLSFILVGNKSDLKAQRAVQQDEINQFAIEHQLEYIEVSSKTGSNVNDAFNQVAQFVYKKIINGDIDVKNENLGVKPGNEWKSTNSSSNHVILDSSNTNANKKKQMCC